MCKQIGAMKGDIRHVSSGLTAATIRESAVGCVREIAKLKVRDVGELNVVGKRTRASTVRALQRKARKLQGGNAVAIGAAEVLLEGPDMNPIDHAVDYLHAGIPHHVASFVEDVSLLACSNSMTHLAGLDILVINISSWDSYSPY
ncbi:hypothetical protein PG991_013826 [Apiospora marii]|uniref:Uncharacterized protein n=1 Tax=Apiospora marii TaxID=335849 RepID=A0ABR1R945_9PEZI